VVRHQRIADADSSEKSTSTDVLPMPPVRSKCPLSGRIEELTHSLSSSHSTTEIGRRKKKKKKKFSIGDLRACIPAHLFERSAARSFAYLARDLSLLTAIAYAATHIDAAAAASGVPAWLLWPLYWVVQGTVATGVWVIAHECGHQAFSDSKTLNDAVGLVLHSALLVPYHPWRITHGSHHKNTNHMDRDHVFVPQPRSALHEAAADSPLMAAVHAVLTVTIGWWLYLTTNATGQKYGRRANHYEPSSPLFKPKDRADVVVSNVALAVVFAALAAWAYATSLATVLCYYWMPYMVVNFYLVTITLLQHTHVDVPHYRGDEWTFVRGALATVDRSYGWIINDLQHHIMDSHVAHHLFSTMPHYNAIQATPYLREKLGVYYKRDDTNFLVALYRAFRDCIFVEDAPAEVLVWKNHKALAAKAH
jgi:omega-6 fatty acid desaturase (delta-12 desaturase)